MRRLLLVLLAISATASAADCDFFARAGANASPRSGECAGTSGDPKSGFERCVHREDKRVLSELTYRAGKREGKGWYTDYNDARLEFTFKADAPEGPGRYVDKNGKLKCEASFVSGKVEGVVRAYHPNGRLAALADWRAGERRQAGVAWNEAGDVERLQCGERSLAAEDRAPCGFDGGTATVTLHTARGTPTRTTLVHRDGKLIEMRTVDRQGRPLVQHFPEPGNTDRYDATVTTAEGKPFRVYSIVARRQHGILREYAAAGGLVEESEFNAGRAMRQTLYYQNGKPRSVATAADTQVRIESYYDTGGPRETATYTEGQYRGVERGGWEGRRADGTVKRYRRDGTVETERQYVKGREHGVSRYFHSSGALAAEMEFANDNMLRRRCLDPAGQVRYSEERFPDGSLKSATPPGSDPDRHCRIE